MSVEVQHRRDPWADLKTVTPAVGEFGHVSDLKTVTTGDGVKLGGHLLAKWGKRHVVAPAAITTDQDDYAPTNNDIAEVLALDSDADWSITGLAGGEADRVVSLVNKGDFRLTLPDQDAGSAAGNRFDFGFNLVLRPRQAVTLAYDATASRWTIAHTGLFSVTEIPENLVLSGAISPAQITATQDDYAPADLATATVLRLTSDASRNITGLSGGAAGRVLTIINTGAAPIVLQDANSNSTAANRFDFGGNVTLETKQTAILWYDTTSSRWRLVAAPPTGGSADVPADLSLLLGQLAMAIADNANVSQFLGDTGNRFADSFDALTYVDTGAATNLDTGTAGLLKPSATVGSDQTATHTGSTGGGNTASASSELGGGYSAWRAFDNVIGDGSGTGDWITNSTTTGYLQYLFGSAKTIASYTLSAPHTSLLARMAKSWSLKASNTGAFGGEETTLDTQTNISFTGGQTQTFTIASPGSYTYYRVVVTANNGDGTNLQISELGLLTGETVNNLTVTSTALTAASAPSSAKLVARVKEIDAITLNTDLIFSVSRDNGATYTAFAMTKKFTANSIAVYESDDLDISGQPTGTNVKWKAASANNKDFEIHDVYLYWT
jgi:hypothetical protein